MTVPLVAAPVELKFQRWVTVWLSATTTEASSQEMGWRYMGRTGFGKCQTPAIVPICQMTEKNPRTGEEPFMWFPKSEAARAKAVWWRFPTAEPFFIPWGHTISQNVSGLVFTPMKRGNEG
ncbi:hypothetical protein GCM10023212_11080 [Luteolibacter yonseiensis]